MSAGSSTGETVQQRLAFDALVVGGGIAGLQSAIELGDQGYKVLIVEKAPSIGGKMIGLSKVFPTLDCSSCICTPRMAAAAHHENITIFTYSEVKRTKRAGSRFQVEVVRNPRYVHEADCIGCRLCEYACPIHVEHEFEGNLGARKAVYVPFANAIPQLALVDLEHCVFCGLCEKVCPTRAIDFLQQSEEITVEVSTIILATGYKMMSPERLKLYGGGRLRNVLTSLQVERLLAPHGPYGRVLRPSDGKVPSSIGYVQCAGSRDQSVGVSYCSRVCCMYAIKQAMLLSGSLPMVDITIYYMDIRAFGKGFEQFFQTAKSMGIEFVKAKVGRITEDGNQNPVVRVEVMEQDGRVEERKHDMVVLSLGLLPGWDPSGVVEAETAADGFIRSADPLLAPARTTAEGIFVAGAAAGPKDIPDSIVEAGAAAMEAAIYLRRNGTQSNSDERAVNEKSAVVAQ
jgi:heterodisulfide reductase subunit A